ncbi:MAG: helix-turn-helix domain-containing protein [Lachnospiraceae bacterium]
MVVNTQKLKGKIVERDTTQEALADAVGVDRSTFYRKMKNGGNGFTVGEIHKIIDAIPLTMDEAISIFFDR